MTQQKIYTKEQETTLEESAKRILDRNEVADEDMILSCTFPNTIKAMVEMAKWQQEQDSNWFNEYQKVEDYIIDKIGDKFLEATPEKYKTASEATIALLENNWQQERMYSEEEVFTICRAFATFVQRNGPSYKKQQEWFKQNKKK